MSAPPSRPAALDAATRAQILGEVVEVAATLANAQLDGFTTRLAQALQDAGPHCSDPVQRALHLRAAGLLRKNRYPFTYVAAERLRTVLAHELQSAARGAVNPSDAGGALKSLAPDAEVDKNISLRKAGRAIEEQHAERLGALGLRLAVLFGRAQLDPAPHPFRAQVFLNVLHDAWCEFQPDTDTHPLVFPLLGPQLCLDMAPILHAANMALIKRGILPQLQGQPVTAAVGTPGEDALTSRLRGLLGEPGTPGAASLQGGFPTLLEPHALGSTPLFDYLDSLQKNLFDQHLAACGADGPQSASVLAHVRRHAPAGSLSETDDQVIVLLAAIFDRALEDPGIGPDLKVLIASLQLPILKAALADRDFFFRPDQPARRSIELLAELAVACEPERGQTDPVFMTLKRNVERIQRGAPQRASVFVDAVWDMESFLRREQTAADQILAAPIAAAEREEKRMQAEKHARHEVALRIGTGEVVAFVETFLENRWVPVLTLAYSEQVEKPEGVKDALQTMDDLVWSVKPKITAAERKELLAMLPRMVASMNKWLSRVQWNHEERARFFAELAACHASLVRAPLDISPQRQVELAMEVARKAAERRAELQARQAAPQQPDAHDRRVQQLASGTWVEFSGPGPRRRLKLAWVAPTRCLFVFATRSSQFAMSMSDEALAAAFRAGHAQVLEARDLVRRALAQALVANDDGGAETAA